MKYRILSLAASVVSIGALQLCFGQVPWYLALSIGAFFGTVGFAFEISNPQRGK